MSWVSDMIDSYKSLNSNQEAMLNSTVEEDILFAALTELEDEFGPSGKDKTVCDFVYIMKIDTALSGRTIGGIRSFVFNQTVKLAESSTGIVEWEKSNSNDPDALIMYSVDTTPFSSLTYFSLRELGLTGALPSFNFPNVVYFDIDGNSFTGEFSATLPNAEWIDIGFNSLSSIKTGLSFPECRIFQAFKNQISGSLPYVDLRKAASWILSEEKYVQPTIRFDYNNITSVSDYLDDLLAKESEYENRDIGISFVANPITYSSNDETLLNSIESTFLGSKINRFESVFIPPPLIYVGGAFTSYQNISSNRIASLELNGNYFDAFSVNNGFNAGQVRDLKKQLDGKIICVGSFTSYQGISSNRIARINANGTLDETFNIGTGFNEAVNSVAIQIDGKILAGGSFTSFNGNTVNRIARLNTDGTLDTTFNIGTGFNNFVRSLDIQPDGKYIVSGGFTAFNGNSRNRLVRLNADGSLDTTFSIGSGLNDYATAYAFQSDDKIILVGWFTSYNNVTHNRIIRLNSNGSVDSTFSTSQGFNNRVFSCFLDENEKLVVGGQFTQYRGVSRNEIVRINSDGTIDENFSIGSGFSGGIVRNVKLDDEGNILCAGNFTSFDGVTSNRIGRLLPTGPRDSSFLIGTGFNGEAWTID